MTISTCVRDACAGGMGKRLEMEEKLQRKLLYMNILCFLLMTWDFRLKLRMHKKTWMCLNVSARKIKKLQEASNKNTVAPQMRKTTTKCNLLLSFPFFSET